MGTFITNKLFIIDKTEEKAKPIRYDNASLEYTEIGEETVKREVKIINKNCRKVRKLPKNFKIVAFDDWGGSLMFFPNVAFERGKYICHDESVVCDNGEKVETPFIFRHHFNFLKKNGIELENDDF